MWLKKNTRWDSKCLRKIFNRLKSMIVMLKVLKLDSTKWVTGLQKSMLWSLDSLTTKLGWRRESDKVLKDCLQVILIKMLIGIKKGMLVQQDRRGLVDHAGPLLLQLLLNPIILLRIMNFFNYLHSSLLTVLRTQLGEILDVKEDSLIMLSLMLGFTKLSQRLIIDIKQEIKIVNSQMLEIKVKSKYKKTGRYLVEISTKWKLPWC